MSSIQRREEQDFHHSSQQDWDNAEAHELGMACPESAWVLTDRDVWHANPFYTGPAVPHPNELDGYGEPDPDEFEPEPVYCPSCNGVATGKLGTLGSMVWLDCRDCGARWAADEVSS